MTSSINEKIKEQIKAKKAEMKKQESVASEEITRARDEKGHYMADDPSTPDVNEAWKGGKAPTKKAKKSVKKKKTVAKKKTTTKKTTKNKE